MAQTSEDPKLTGLEPGLGGQDPNLTTILDIVRGSKEASTHILAANQLIDIGIKGFLDKQQVTQILIQISDHSTDDSVADACFRNINTLNDTSDFTELTELEGLLNRDPWARQQNIDNISQLVTSAITTADHTSLLVFVHILAYKHRRAIMQALKHVNYQPLDTPQGKYLAQKVLEKASQLPAAKVKDISPEDAESFAQLYVASDAPNLSPLLEKIRDTAKEEKSRVIAAAALLKLPPVANPNASS